MKVKVFRSCLTLRPHGLYSPWNSPGQNTGVGSLSLLQGIFSIQGSNPGVPHCRQILYQQSHKGSPRMLEWVAYPFSSGSSWPKNWTRVSCIAGRFFTNWAIREAFFRYFTFIGYYRILSRVPFAYSRSLLFIYFIHSFLTSLQVKTKVKMMADRLLLAASLPRGLLPPAPCLSAPVTLASLLVFSHTVKWLTPAPFHLLFPYDMLPHWF